MGMLFAGVPRRPRKTRMDCVEEDKPQPYRPHRGGMLFKPLSAKMRIEAADKQVIAAFNQLQSTHVERQAWQRLMRVLLNLPPLRDEDL